MKKITLLILSVCYLLTSCSVKPTITSEYKLDTFSEKKVTNHSNISILVAQPEALAGYDSQDMRYVSKPFELSTYAHNAWVDTPADMLLPLILQSLQRSGYFAVVTSAPITENTDYRLDTQLIELEQNFLTKPSRIDLTVKVVLTHVPDNRVVASEIISEHVTCLSDTPYGGVVAANQATKLFTAQLTDFVVTHTRNDKK
ncbi:ABC transporter auxiliary component [Legionella busanensis]|uniref:ABC transporter auxiliary component n=1 Tax=Legionella busanensis TaxID=190655 RepID=A0A378JN50_9GAMM|nr:ABC-type transport auxiliary lipoprotein family protein [Legionella busanensis]STX52507.1 ABC transporter auxiliary component [Legionella busanensis]